MHLWCVHNGRLNNWKVKIQIKYLVGICMMRLERIHLVLPLGHLWLLLICNTSITIHVRHNFPAGLYVWLCVYKSEWERENSQCRQQSRERRVKGVACYFKQNKHMLFSLFRQTKQPTRNLNSPAKFQIEFSLCMEDQYYRTDVV